VSVEEAEENIRIPPLYKRFLPLFSHLVKGAFKQNKDSKETREKLQLKTQNDL
jgi:hypothetical protein